MTMNAQESFLIAALICGFFGLIIAALWRVTGTNQGERVKWLCIGCSCGAIALAGVFLLLSLIVKN